MRRQFYPLSRPQSAKPGYKGYWGQGSQSEFNDQDNSSKGGYRKNVKLMKPDLTTNDFARILPKKIYQDKERLYSQALQLKQNLNQTLEENIRLKTRITILQKQKDKLTKHIEVGRENPNINKTNSRVNIYSGKAGEKENMMIRNLKKMVRQSKEENDFLKQENAKIKKAIKYTKINEIQIQRKMFQDQNKRLATLLEEMNNQLANQENFEQSYANMERRLEDQIEANKQLNQANLKYIDECHELQQKLAMEVQKFQNRQNKLQRELALNKRKLNESLKQVENLKQQINNLRLQSTNIKNQPGTLKPQSINGNNQRPKITRPVSSNPYKSQGTLMGVRVTTQNKKQTENQQIKNIQLENQQLKEELSKAKIKIEETERQAKRQRHVSTLDDKQNKNNKPEIQRQKYSNQEENSLKQQREPKVIQNKNDSEEIPSKEKQDTEKYDDDNYENEYDQESSPEPKISQKKDKPQIDQYRKDFQEEEEEEPLYIKEDSPQKKKSKKEKTEKQSKKDLKGDKNEAAKKKKQKKDDKTYKPDKKMLTEIKQLLTYRMKAQRYPYEQLKRDIQQAKEKQFSMRDLKGMFVNEPFYLTQKYSEALIQYCFENTTPKQGQMITNEVLLTKLRKVIDHFSLIQEKQEEQMLLRIAEMVTQYPDQLQTAFDKIKNGEETVTKQDLTQMFLNLELETKYIELIIQELSLCSSDLEHLNFIGFFERFYVENMSGIQNGRIDEEQMQSSSEEVSKNLKPKDAKKLKQISHEFDDNDENLVVDDNQRISLGNDDNKEYDDADIVSDDGPI